MKATLWNYCWPDDPQPGLLHLEPPALSGEPSLSIQCGGGTSEEQDEIARRLAALWNAAEELELTTEQVEDGIIQMTFIDGRARLQECISEKKEAQRAAGRLKDQYENVSKHYSRRGEDIERLEAEKNEMRDVITKLLQVVEFYEPVDRHRELIRRAKTTIGREEE